MADSKTPALKSTEVPKLYESVVIAHPDASIELQKDLFKKIPSDHRSVSGNNSFDGYLGQTHAHERHRKK